MPESNKWLQSLNCFFYNYSTKIIAMKTLLSSLLLFSSISIFSQSCLPEGVKFSRQSQVDSFRILYPGCTVIDGDVSIFLNSNFLNIDSLNHFQNIKGNM